MKPWSWFSNRERNYPTAPAYRILPDGTRQVIPPKLEPASKARRGKVGAQGARRDAQGGTRRQGWTV